MSLYYRLCENYNKNQLIPVTESPYSHITNYDVPWFTSCFLYNEEHKKRFEETGSFAGITDNVTNKLWWDFDSEDLDKAQKDANTLYKRLIERGCTTDNIHVSFSGNKGYAIVVKVDKYLNRRQVENICKILADGLSTFDNKVYDNQRIFRVPLTINEKTKLFKVPLSENQFLKLSTSTIKEKATNPEGQKQYNNNKVKWSITDEWVKSMQPPEKKKEIAVVSAIDWAKKPKGWRNCKWSLLQGNFKTGERHNALTILAATARGMGYDKETTYYLCKSAIKKQAKQAGIAEFSKDELWENIIEQSVFGNSWNGGQYSCGSDTWLSEYCKNLGEHACKSETAVTIGTKEMHQQFNQFVKDIDKNILYSGIPSLDKKIKFMIGTSNGVVGAPGSGKTSMALEILNHNSKKGIPCIFFSYDMFLSAVYLKILARHTDYKTDDIINIYKMDEEKKQKLQEIMDTEYANVEFCYKSGQNAEEIRDTIREVEGRLGKKVKMCIIDYNELVMSDLSDMTASSSQTAQKIRQIAHEQQICCITMMQPTKGYFEPANEIKTMAAAKGSGAVVQALTLLLGCSRPGFNPFKPENDKFFSLSGLKNRTGPLFSIDTGWDGSRGTFYELTPEQRAELKTIREERDAKQALTDTSW